MNDEKIDRASGSSSEADDGSSIRVNKREERLKKLKELHLRRVISCAYVLRIAELIMLTVVSM